MVIRLIIEVIFFSITPKTKGLLNPNNYNFIKTLMEKYDFIL